MVQKMLRAQICCCCVAILRQLIPATPGGEGLKTGEFSNRSYDVEIH